jgi:hypothetical protein
MRKFVRRDTLAHAIRETFEELIQSLRRCATRSRCQFEITLNPRATSPVRAKAKRPEAAPWSTARGQCVYSGGAF